MKRQHSMPFGAERCGEDRVRFRLWGPAATEVHLCLIKPSGEVLVPMTQSDGGWFELCTDLAQVGSYYKFHIDGGVKVSDPASRFQPSDVHRPSEVIDPASFYWNY